MGVVFYSKLSFSLGRLAALVEPTLYFAKKEGNFTL